MTLRLAAEAEADLDDLWLYVAAMSGSSAADRLVDPITQRFLLLTMNP
jgi:plasmid stabilization system protein ParE